MNTQQIIDFRKHLEGMLSRHPDFALDVMIETLEQHGNNSANGARDSRFRRGWLQFTKGIFSARIAILKMGEFK